MRDHNYKNIFNDLFVLELANNHWGSVERGIRIIQQHAQVVRFNGIKAAIKLQLRDVENFIHENYKSNQSIRYIKKTEGTKLSISNIKILVDTIKSVGCIPMATPFDESSVDVCDDLDLPIIKIASSDVNDWPLIEKISSKRKPVIISTGGVSEKDLDDVVLYFEHREIPLAINHCVSLYPCEDSELILDQIDYLIKRYPSHVIGLSTHEYHDWASSMLISYAKGARTWERHIDIEDDSFEVSPYCSLPNNCDVWFKAYKKAQQMCGGLTNQKRLISKKEIEYLDKLVRGVYAKRNIKKGYAFSSQSFTNDFYLAIPLLKGQLSCREVLNGEILVEDLNKDQPLTIKHIDGPCVINEAIVNTILSRGIGPDE